MKLDGLLAKMSSLARPCVRMKDSEKVSSMISRILADGSSQLQVILDFDRTVNRVRDSAGRVIPDSCFAILDQSPRMPQFFKDETKRMRDKYYPIEIDPHLTIEQKLPMAIEWYSRARELMQRVGLKKQDLVAMVNESSAQLREGTDKLLSRLYGLDVPVLIFSAGLGDIIHALLDKHADDHENIKVVSNYMKFDDEGKMIGFHREMIHMYNKNEDAIHHSAYFERLRGRHNVILMGDNVGDLHMADGVEDPQVVLRIGFLNDYSEERLAKFLDLFDVVLVDDQTMDFANDIVAELS